MLQTQGIAAGPLLDDLEILQDPHMIERGFYQELPHEEVGTLKYHGPGWSMSNTPNKLRQAAPLLGEHNEYVYKEILGFTDADYKRLEEEGHIGMDMMPNVP